MPKWLVVLVALLAATAYVPQVRHSVINWLKTHPALIGPALTVAGILAVLYLFIDPTTILFLAVVAVVSALAAFFDPRTYSSR
ncbi:hypothetical protein ABIA03_002475 [Bradyrhizobium yuanmingense]|uniref:Uncharacterized protein n=1 Tax=Bradyrhizobium yuanmingense TaxID=108015 RepID=A0ABV4GIB0_9BRAD